MKATILLPPFGPFEVHCDEAQVTGEVALIYADRDGFINKVTLTFALDRFPEGRTVGRLCDVKVGRF